MENQFSPLRNIIARFLDTFQPIAVRQQSFFVNEVPADFMVSVEEKTLTQLMHSMMSALAGHSRNSCIRISAKQYSNIALLKFRDLNGEIVYDMNYSRQQVMLLTEKLGACIIANDNKRKTTTLTLSFPNIPHVA